MDVLAVLLVGYLVGSVPVAVVVSRRVAGVDVRDGGDRNMGWWNAKAQLGRRAALPVLVGDTLKGTLAGLAWLGTGTGWPVGYLAVGAAMVGHAYPVFAGFRGGRSILTFAGGMAVLAPPTFVVGVALCALVSVVRSFAVGARVAVFAVPLVQLALEPAWPPYRVASTGALLSFIGLRFALAGRSAPATGGTGAARPT